MTVAVSGVGWSQNMPSWLLLEGRPRSWQYSPVSELVSMADWPGWMGTLLPRAPGWYAV
jgi:hypothetical protein